MSDHKGPDQVAAQLTAELVELLRDRTLTFDQLASCFSIKHGKPLLKVLKEASEPKKAIALGDFFAARLEVFELPEGTVKKVRVRPESGLLLPQKAAATAAAPSDAAPSADPGGAVVRSEVATPATAPAAPAAVLAPPAAGAGASMRYAELSRALQSLLKEHQEPLEISELEALFHERFGCPTENVAGMPLVEYLARKAAVFELNAARGKVSLQASLARAAASSASKAQEAPAADDSMRLAEANVVRDEAFVVRELAALLESIGPVGYISTVCGKFIQRHGFSVSSIVNVRPLDVVKRHPDTFMVIGAGNVTLTKFQEHPEVLRLLSKDPKSQRVAARRQQELTQPPLPEVITVQHVVDEFRRLILADGVDVVYISSLCGRFLQRFGQPVTAIINCKPVDFLRQYPEIFVLTGCGNVGLREVLGEDAVSIEPPPPRLPRDQEDSTFSKEQLEQVDLSAEVCETLYSKLLLSLQAAKEQLEDVCKLIGRSSFLQLDEVVLAGPLAKTMPSAGGRQAEIVLFVKKLPLKNFSQWLPYILETLIPVLEAQLLEHRAQNFRAAKDRIFFRIIDADERPVQIVLFLSPVFTSYGQYLHCLRENTTSDRQCVSAAMAKERLAFLSTQREQVQTLMGLICFWASRQTWSSASAAPSDWLLQLLTVHTCWSLRRLDLRDGLDAILDAMAAFGKVKVTWQGFGVARYSLQDVPRELRSRECFFLDILEPYSNLAADGFDPKEMIALAQRKDRLLALRREAASFVAAPSNGSSRGSTT